LPSANFHIAVPVEHIFSSLTKKIPVMTIWMKPDIFHACDSNSRAKELQFFIFIFETVGAHRGWQQFATTI
jgi:hypothetical protein